MSTQRPTDAGFRSLADQLRSWSDAELSRLLHERPDLTTPAPHDFGQLASRATVRASLSRALDALSRLELSILDALIVAVHTSRPELTRIIHARPAAVDAGLDRLLALALVWRSTQGLRPVTGVAEALGVGPGSSGLRPRSTEPWAVEDVSALLTQLSPPASAMLAHVVDHGGEATTGAARQTVLPEDATSPAEELLARRLLVPRQGGGVGSGGTGRSGAAGGTTVVAPGEVGLAVREGRTTTDPVDVVPEVATSERDPALVDRTAAGAAFESSRRVELLLDQWGTRPPPVLRSGGLAVRDLKAAASLLHVDEQTAALTVEVAAEAGLLGARADAGGEQVWVPTDAYDAWITLVGAERWLGLARAWAGSSRTPHLVGTRDQSGKTWNALAPDLVSLGMAEARSDLLAALATLEPGRTPAAGTGLPSLLELVDWRRPRRPRSREDHVRHALREAAALGVTGLDSLSSFGRVLDTEQARDLLAGLLPTPVDHVLLQADLTAVAPGPLEAGLARRLQLVADVESRGGATTYRFTPGSVRRALDVGWTAAELHDFLDSVSRTPVPQPLAYLVDDAVRTFGTVRVGHAEAFLRADDESALTELLHHPRAGSLGLRRLAPTVLVSTTPVDVLLPRLRELGASPVVEGYDGTVAVSRPDQLRARSPRPARATAVRETARTASVVTAIRSGDRATRERPTAPGAPLTPSGALAALREAMENDATVTIGYVDNQGVAGDRVVDPIRIEGGQLTARDHRADDERQFAVHRITTVRTLEG